jgi:co-chaperonin GroES (HSP10)
MQPKTLTLDRIPRIGPKIPDLAAPAKEPTRIKTELGYYDVVPFGGVNDSGYQPIGDRVLILVDQAAEMTGALKAIELPSEIRERIALAAETGVIVALGEAAFEWNADRTRPFGGTKPTVGTRVYFERYAGGKVLGRDGKWYRCMDDKTIGCVCIE